MTLGTYTGRVLVPALVVVLSRGTHEYIKNSDVYLDLKQTPFIGIFIKQNLLLFKYCLISLANLSRNSLK